MDQEGYTSLPNGVVGQEDLWQQQVQRPGSQAHILDSSQRPQAIVSMRGEAS